MSVKDITDTSYIKGVANGFQLNGRLYNLYVDGSIFGPGGIPLSPTAANIQALINLSKVDSNGKIDIYGLTQDLAGAIAGNEPLFLIGTSGPSSDTLFFQDANGTLIAVGSPGGVDTIRSKNLILINNNNIQVDPQYESIIISNSPQSLLPGMCDSLTVYGNDKYYILVTDKANSANNGLFQVEPGAITSRIGTNGTISHICGDNTGPGPFTTLTMTNNSVRFQGLPVANQTNVIGIDPQGYLYYHLLGGVTEISLIGNPIHCFLNSGSGPLQYRGMTSPDGSISFNATATNIEITSTQANPNPINGQVVKSPPDGSVYIHEISNSNQSALVLVSEGPAPIVQISSTAGSVDINTPALSLTALPNVSALNQLLYDNLTSKVSYFPTPVMSGCLVSLTAPISLGSLASNQFFSGSVMAVNGLHNYNSGIWDAVNGFIMPTKTAKYAVDCSFNCTSLGMVGYRDWTLQFTEQSPLFAILGASKETIQTSSSITSFNTFTLSCVAILDAGGSYRIGLSVGAMNGLLTSCTLNQLHYSYISVREIPY